MISRESKERKEKRNEACGESKAKPSKQNKTKQNKTLRNLWLKNILATKPSKFELIKPPQK